MRSRGSADGAPCAWLDAADRARRLRPWLRPRHGAAMRREVPLNTKEPDGPDRIWLEPECCSDPRSIPSALTTSRRSRNDMTPSAIAAGAFVAIIGFFGCAQAEGMSPDNCFETNGCTSGGGLPFATIHIPSGQCLKENSSGNLEAARCVAECPNGYEAVWRDNMRQGCAKDVIDTK